MPAYVYDKKTNELVKVAGNAANADLKDMNVYSTEEKIVGTWIDGKPIYRKVIVSTFGLSPASSKKILLNNDIETPVSCTFISDNGGGVGIRNDGGVYASFFPTDINIRTTSGWTLSSGTQKIIIEFTKTTD